jgi:hypothetical protein
MTYATDSYTGDGSTTTYNISFDVLRGDEIIASIAGVETTAFTLDTGFTQLTFDDPPANAAAILIFRRTNIADAGRPVDFQDGGPVVADDLDKCLHYLLHGLQEVYDGAILNGIQGPPGPQGPQGDPGPQGPPGNDGADGADGTGADDTAVFMAM